jgi:hypothetical protein
MTHLRGVVSIAVMLAGAASSARSQEHYTPSHEGEVRWSVGGGSMSASGPCTPAANSRLCDASAAPSYSARLELGLSARITVGVDASGALFRAGDDAMQSHVFLITGSYYPRPRAFVGAGIGGTVYTARVGNRYGGMAPSAYALMAGWHIMLRGERSITPQATAILSSPKDLDVGGSAAFSKAPRGLLVVSLSLSDIF